jgi:hypothetical protein
MKTLPVLVAVGTWLCAFPLNAQNWGGGWGGPVYRPATAAESYQRGFADVVRSAGAANLMNSAAMQNVEAARSQYIDNRLKATQTYFDMKRENKAYKEETQKPRPTSEQLFRLAKGAAPQRLAPTELDPVTGQVAWPLALQSSAFDSYRSALEELYAERANSSGSLSLEQQQQARRTIQQMRDELTAQINDLPPQAFSQASAFLRRLDHEANFAG